MATATPHTKPPSSSLTVPVPALAAQSVVFPPDVVHLLDVLTRIEVRRRTRPAVATTTAALVSSMRKVG